MGKPTYIQNYKTKTGVELTGDCFLVGCGRAASLKRGFGGSGVPNPPQCMLLQSDKGVLHLLLLSNTFPPLKLFAHREREHSG